jgi:hypothetical protein
LVEGVQQRIQGRDTLLCPVLLIRDVQWLARDVRRNALVDQILAEGSADAQASLSGKLQNMHRDSPKILAYIREDNGRSGTLTGAREKVKEQIGWLLDMDDVDQETWQREYTYFKKYASAQRGLKLLAEYAKTHEKPATGPGGQTSSPVIVSLEADKAWAKELKFEQAMCVLAYLDKLAYGDDKRREKRGSSKRKFVTWTTEEEQKLRRLKTSRLPWKQIASQLNKKEKDCQNRWNRIDHQNGGADTAV